MVVPRLVGQALSGSPITIFGSGEQTRCFGHVTDVVEALIGLMKSTEAEGQVFNVGARGEISINDLALKITELTGSTSEIIRIPYDQAYEVGFEDMQRRRPDIRKINALLGWEPTRDLDDVINDVAADLKSRSTT